VRTPAVGTKFHAGGSVRRFPGSSIVCAVGQDSTLADELEWIQRASEARSFGPKLAQLPRSSFHMTAVDLICDEVRTPEHWSSHLPLDTPLDEVDRWMQLRCSGVVFPAPPRMRVARLGPPDTTVHLQLDPADDTTAEALQTFRDRIAEVTGVRHRVHDVYRFHISLSYALEVFDAADRAAFQAFGDEVMQRLGRTLGEVQLGEPQLVFFPDMGSFPTRRSG